jgi:pyruvate kinase
MIATVEKYLLMENHIKKIVLAGADVFRLNFSYSTIEENVRHITVIQQTIDELNSSTKILIDFPINKVRLGDFELKLFPVNENDKITLKSGIFTFDCYDYIPVQLTNLGNKLSIGQSITLGDGEVSIIVSDIIDDNTIKAVVQNKGVIQYMKSFNVTQEIDEDKIIKNFKEIIEQIKHLDTHYFAISYYNATLFDKLTKIIRKEKKKKKIILKIEDWIGLDQMEKIFAEDDFDLILIDRGELGVNTPYYKVGIYQKQITAMAIKYKKPVIISTQIIESTMSNYVPNRAEILDITNMVLDGVSGILLCRETAINQRAAYTIATAKKIITEAEKYRDENKY